MNQADSQPSPAELFEQFFGPAIFFPWTEVLLDYADPQPGERVLDLACATGIVARRTAPAVEPDGRVVGLDISPDMLGVARERGSAEQVTVDWREGDATDLDLPQDSFDLVLCQQGLQFFDDPARALAEVRRVLVDGGRLVLSVWQPLDRHPVYSALLKAEARHLDAPLEEVARPFMFGTDDDLRVHLREGGFGRVEIEEETLQVEFPQPETFVAMTVSAAAAVVPEFAEDDPEARARLIEAIARDCDDVLRRYRTDQRLRFPAPNYLAVAS